MVELNENPLETWNDLKIQLPKPYAVAYKYLTMVGTSVSSERLFSKAAQIVNQQRNRLQGKRLNKLLFLQSLTKKKQCKEDVFKIADDFYFICIFCNDNTVINITLVYGFYFFF